MTLVTQSRIASLIASFSVRDPDVDLDHFGAEQPHAEDVERLARHVVGAHVDVALEAEQRAHRRGRDAVLPGAGLGDDPPLPHPRGEQRLAERVVDLVRAGVREVLALEDDAGAAGGGGQPLRLVERRRPADVVAQQVAELGPEALFVADPEVRLGQLLDRRHQRLGHEPAAVGAVVARARQGRAVPKTGPVVIRFSSNATP